MRVTKKLRQAKKTVNGFVFPEAHVVAYRLQAARRVIKLAKKLCVKAAKGLDRKKREKVTVKAALRRHRQQGQRVRRGQRARRQP